MEILFGVGLLLGVLLGAVESFKLCMILMFSLGAIVIFNRSCPEMVQNLFFLSLATNCILYIILCFKGSNE
jgi:hypothetical protein